MSAIAIGCVFVSVHFGVTITGRRRTRYMTSRNDSLPEPITAAARK